MRWSKNRKDILFNCWKEADNYKDRIILAEKKLTDISMPEVLKAMRKFARTEPEWLKWSNQKNKEKERQKLEKKKEKERILAERAKKRKLREERKMEKEKDEKHKNILTALKTILNTNHKSKLEQKIKSELFFCPDVQHYVNNISCIYRVFGEDTKYKFIPGGPCEKCKRMDKYLDTIKEVINAGENKK